jgi:hypothetical protein
MDDSILNSIKKLLGIAEDYEYFDSDILVHINSVFIGLAQLGVGPKNPFHIYDKTAVWDDFMQGDPLDQVKSYVYFKVRLMFDPPSGTAMDAMKSAISELEWRLTNNENILNAYS